MGSSTGSELIKNFSNAVVTWKVENFSLILSTKKKIISSPPITLVGPTDTHWRIHLELSKKHLLLNVEMLENIFLKCKVHLRWAYCLLDEFEKGLFTSERSHTFKPKMTLLMENIKTEDALEIASKKKYDNLIIKCRMLVDFDQPIQFPKLRATGVEHLSNALRKLPTSFIHHNTTTKVRNVEFSLHEAMLFFRGAKLMRLMKQSKFNLSDYGDNYHYCVLEPMAAKEVIEYLYTGSLISLLYYPCLTKSDYIQHLEILGLEDVYSAQRITVSTKTELREQMHAWTVSNIQNKTGTVFRQKFKIEGLTSHLQLSVKVEKSRDDPTKKELSVIVKLTESTLSLRLRLDVSFGKNENQILCTQRIHGVMDPYVERGATFLENDHPEMNECFLDDTLFIKVHVYRSIGNVLSYIVVNENPASRKIAYENSFMNLSETLGEMKKTAIHSDFYFKVGEHEIKSHKFLAAARSPLMKELFRRHKGLDCVEVFGCTMNVFETFLHYMYVGILTENNTDKLIELYKFGEPYKVDGLLEDVLDFLSRCVDEANVFKVLIFADEIHDDELKNKAFTYVIKNSNILKNHKDLDMFRIKTPIIYSEIQEYLSVK